MAACSHVGAVAREQDKHLRATYPVPVPTSSESPDQLIATTRPIDSVDDLIAMLPAGENVCWVRRGEGMVGWGVAARLQVRGVERFARTQRWWAELCERLTVDDSVSVPGTGPIAFASYAFDANDASEVVVPDRKSVV